MFIIYFFYIFYFYIVYTFFIFPFFFKLYDLNSYQKLCKGKTKIQYSDGLLQFLIKFNFSLHI
jgi:hypothetical protein